MPILAEECSLFPDGLLDGIQEESTERATTDDRSESQWRVVCTRPRQEKSLARDLLKREIPFYLPLVKKTSIYHRQTIHSFSPLFAGYVFLYASLEQQQTALRTNRISQLLSVDAPDRLLHDLRQVRQLIASNVPLTMEGRLTPGQRVRVRRGPLAGLEGTILERRGLTRLLVKVDFLQQGASIEIDDYMLEPTEYYPGTKEDHMACGTDCQSVLRTRRRT